MDSSDIALLLRQGERRSGRLIGAFGTGDPRWVDFYAPDVEAEVWSGRANDTTVYRGLDGIKNIAARFTEGFAAGTESW